MKTIKKVIKNTVNKNKNDIFEFFTSLNILKFYLTFLLIVTLILSYLMFERQTKEYSLKYEINMPVGDANMDLDDTYSILNNALDVDMFFNFNRSEFLDQKILEPKTQYLEKKIKLALNRNQTYLDILPDENKIFIRNEIKSINIEKITDIDISFVITLESFPTEEIKDKINSYFSYLNILVNKEIIQKFNEWTFANAQFLVLEGELYDTGQLYSQIIQGFLRKEDISVIESLKHFSKIGAKQKIELLNNHNNRLISNFEKESLDLKILDIYFLNQTATFKTYTNFLYVYTTFYLIFSILFLLLYTAYRFKFSKTKR